MKNKGSLGLNWINKDKSLYYEYDKDGNPGKPIWVDKKDIRVAEPRVLKLVKEYGDCSGLKDPLDNALIKGDNLLALRTLVELFKNRPEKDKVKCAYIDPPYNTGNAFDHYDDNLAHSEWLTMMKGRIKLIHSLLRMDGALFIQIDYVEMPYLKVLIDEIFNRKNFVQLISVKTAAPAGFKTVNPGPIDVTEYILFYIKDKKKFNFKKIFIEGRYDKNYKYYIENMDFGFENWRLVDIQEIVYKNLGIKDWNDSKRRWRNAKKKFGDNYNKIIEALVADFALKNYKKIIRICDPQDAGGSIKKLIEKSKKKKNKFFKLKRREYGDAYAINGGLVAFYRNKIKEIDGKKIPSILLTDFWYDIPWEGIQGEGQVKFKKSKKPEKLIKRILELSTEKGDLVLDSFLGSGTTSAVAHKMNRRWIGIEIGKHAEELCIPRIRSVIKGQDHSGISNVLNWKGGGGFRYYELGDTLIKDNDLNWKLNKKGKLIAEAIFLNTNFKYQKQIQEGVFFGKKRKKYALCIIDKNLKVLNKKELKSIINNIPQDYDILEIFTNLGIAIKPNELDKSIQLKKLPYEIQKKFSGKIE